MLDTKNFGQNILRFPLWPNHEVKCDKCLATGSSHSDKITQIIKEIYSRINYYISLNFEFKTTGPNSYEVGYC